MKAKIKTTKEFRASVTISLQEIKGAVIKYVQTLYSEFHIFGDDEFEISFGDNDDEIEVEAYSLREMIEESPSAETL